MSAPQPIRHGTPSGARAHYRRGEKPCEPCRVAANTDRHGGDPYRVIEPEKRGPARNGLAIVAYEYRARRYRWAKLAIRRAEAVYGRPDDEMEEAS
jgi:hypothetical protein